MKFLFRLPKKQILLLFSLLFLLIAIPLTLFLVKKTQIFKPKALGEASTLVVLDGSGNQLSPDSSGVYNPTGTSVKFKLNYNAGSVSTPVPGSTTSPGGGGTVTTRTCTTTPANCNAGCVISGGNCGTGTQSCYLTGPAPCTQVPGTKPCTVACSTAPPPAPKKSSGTACSAGTECTSGLCSAGKCT